MKKRSLAELREKALARWKGEGRIKVLVSTGSSGLAVGAKRVLRALREELVRRDISGVEVTPGGEWGLTAEEPLVAVKEERRITLYGKVDEELARRIVGEHLAAGEPVRERLVEMREVAG